MGKGGTIDFERPYNDFAVFWSSAASRKAAKMRKKYVRKFVVFLDVENTSRNGVFIFLVILGVHLGSPGAIFLVFFESLIFSEKRGQGGRRRVDLDRPPASLKRI